MMNDALLNPRFLTTRRAWGALLLRLFVGFVLVYGTIDNVMSAERMAEFEAFLATNGFPAPALAAPLSAYAQFVCGILIIIGFAVRPAAAVMIVNFVVALLMVHVGLPFSSNISPLAMLFCNIFLLFNGAGILSVDERSRRDPSIMQRPV